MYHPSTDQRGGFQNRDVGIPHTDGFGPDYGLDYALYSAPNDEKADKSLESHVRDRLHDLFHDEVQVKARNGFVILTGDVRDNITRDILIAAIADMPFVKQIINQLRVEAVPEE